MTRACPKDKPPQHAWGGAQVEELYIPELEQMATPGPLQQPPAWMALR
jgi:hypothetical protein